MSRRIKPLKDRLTYRQLQRRSKRIARRRLR